MDPGKLFLKVASPLIEFTEDLLVFSPVKLFTFYLFDIHMFTYSR